jgi:hypothetical protein
LEYSEKRTLQECESVNQLLLKKEEALTEQMYEKEKSADKLRAEYLLLQKKYEEDIQDMSDFLDDYFPAHVVDDAGPLGDECDLKILLEVGLNYTDSISSAYFLYI